MLDRVPRQQMHRRQRRSFTGRLHDGGALEAHAESSPATAQLSNLQRAADAMTGSVAQRFPTDRPVLEAYLKEIGTKLDMNAEDRSEILDTAQDLGTLEECKAWLDDWVDAMTGLPKAIEKALRDVAIKGELRDDLMQEGIREEAVLDEEFDSLMRLLQTINQADDRLANPGISKTQKGVQTKNRNRAIARYETELKEVKARIAREAEEARQEQRAQEQRENFEQDKSILEQWVHDNASGGAAEVLSAVLAAHTLGSGFDASVAKKFIAADIVLAHRK